MSVQMVVAKRKEALSEQNNMRALVWNCRGLGAPRSVRACQKLIRMKHPDLVFLMETKLNMGETERLKHKLGLKNAIWVSCKGEGCKKAGGLGVLWEEEVETDLISY